MRYALKFIAMRRFNYFDIATFAVCSVLFQYSAWVAVGVGLLCAVVSIVLEALAA